MDNISPKMTFSKDDNTNNHVFSRPQDVEELEFFNRPWIEVKKERENQRKKEVSIRPKKVLRRESYPWNQYHHH